MIHLFNRELLVTESDPQQVGHVKDVLQQARISYSIDPLRCGSRFGQARDASMAAQFGMRYSMFNTTTFVYKIYVRRQDHRRARQILYGK